MLKAIIKFFRNIFKRSERRVNEAADGVYTGSASGIADAVDDEADRLKDQYQELRDAVAQVQMVLEDRSQALEDLNTKEADKIELRDGALAKFEEAEAAGNEADITKWEDHYVRLTSEIEEIEEKQAGIRAQIDGAEQTMKVHEGNLTKLQRRIQELPQEKAELIANYVSNNALIELSDRLNGMKTSLDSGALDAIRKQDRELSAKAKVTTRLDGTDSAREDDELRAAGRKLAGREQMRAALAARKAEKAASTGAAPVEKEERPQI